jgi:hypothetical protein
MGERLLNFESLSFFHKRNMSKKKSILTLKTKTKKQKRMNKTELQDKVQAIIGSSLFWKDDSPYSIETVSKAIVDLFEAHPVSKSNARDNKPLL